MNRSFVNKASWSAKLSSTGYCIIPELIDPSTLAQIDQDLASDFAQTPFSQGDFYGYRTKRLGGLLKRSARLEKLILEPLILELASEILGPNCDRVQLNVAQAIEIHSGEKAQFPHRDEDMWRGSKGGGEYLLNVMWPLTPFTAENGATSIYPASHAAKNYGEGTPIEVISAQALPGAAICFLGSTLHGAGANISLQPRRGIVIGYSLGWLKPYENPWLAYPPSIARHFSSQLAELVGYVQHRPNLGNYEGQCPSILLQDDVPLYLGAIDALRPDQAAMLKNPGVDGAGN